MPASASTTQSLSQLMQFVLNKNNRFVNQWTFYIPPESHEQQEPVRANIVRTLAGGYTDLFGPDLPPITIEGTTGYNIRKLENGSLIDGYQHWLDFLRQIFRVFIESPITDSNSSYRLHYYNWTHQQYYSVIPTDVTWDMAVPENTVFYYHISLIGLEPLARPGTPPYSLSFDSLVANAPTYFRDSAVSGVKHSTMAKKLLGVN